MEKKEAYNENYHQTAILNNINNKKQSLGFSTETSPDKLQTQVA